MGLVEVLLEALALLLGGFTGGAAWWLLDKAVAVILAGAQLLALLLWGESLGEYLGFFIVGYVYSVTTLLLVNALEGRDEEGERDC